MCLQPKEKPVILLLQAIYKEREIVREKDRKKVANGELVVDWPLITCEREVFVSTTTTTTSKAMKHERRRKGEGDPEDKQRNYFIAKKTDNEREYRRTDGLTLTDWLTDQLIAWLTD